MRTSGTIGALVVVGLAQAASAQVSDVSFTFEIEVPDQLDFNTGNSLGNESFVEQGGFELVPYSGSGRGGLDDVVASVSLSASLDPDGAFSGSGINSATDPYETPSNARSRTTIDFTVAGSLAFEFEYNAFFDNDGGFYSAILTGPGGTVFASSALFPGDNSEMFSGVLPAGDYQLVTRARSRGNIGYSFTIVPAPATGMLIGMAGLFSTLHRREL